MASDIFFRISFILLWVMIGIIRGYYGRKTKTHDSLAGMKEKLKTADQEMGRGVMVLTGIITIVGGAGLILYLLSPPWWTWTTLPLGALVQWLGIVIAIPPLFYLIWVHQHLDTQWSIALELQEDHKLIISGPYRRVRHPMYLGIFVYTTGLILIASDILVFVFFAFSIWVNYRRIPSEEEMMTEQFGDEYLEYMRRTGRIFPRFNQDE
ncbi:MAG: isoprenylcysteine carboxylmethyltransferase family protein [Candidatus Thorarchaeota archaeon]|jgi:protein-S-isoprenylcysteine O-methyltransferase Ste14